MPKSTVRTLAEVRDSRAGLNICMACGAECKVMCRVGTGVCSENCEKKLKSIAPISEKAGKK